MAGILSLFAQRNESKKRDHLADVPLKDWCRDRWFTVYYVVVPSLRYSTVPLHRIVYPGT